jgi:hypothetical protein
LVFPRKKNGNPSFGNGLVGRDQENVVALTKDQIPSFSIAHDYLEEIKIRGFQMGRSWQNEREIKVRANVLCVY